MLTPYVAAGYARLECYQCDSTAGVTSSKYCKAEDPNLKKINRIKMPADSECYRCYKSGECHRCYTSGGCYKFVVATKRILAQRALPFKSRRTLNLTGWKDCHKTMLMCAMSIGLV